MSVLLLRKTSVNLGPVGCYVTSTSATSCCALQTLVYRRGWDIGLSQAQASVQRPQTLLWRAVLEYTSRAPADPWVAESHQGRFAPCRPAFIRAAAEGLQSLV